MVLGLDPVLNITTAPIKGWDSAGCIYNIVTQSGSSTLLLGAWLILSLHGIQLKSLSEILNLVFRLRYRRCRGLVDSGQTSKSWKLVPGKHQDTAAISKIRYESVLHE